MLDRKFIIDNADRVRQNCADRGVTVDIDRFLELESQRKSLQIGVEQLNRQANEVAKSIGKAKDESQREAAKAEGRRLREETTAAQTELDRIAAEADGLQRGIPNMSHPVAPR